MESVLTKSFYSKQTKKMPQKGIAKKSKTKPDTTNKSVVAAYADTIRSLVDEQIKGKITPRQRKTLYEYAIQFVASVNPDKMQPSKMNRWLRKQVKDAVADYLLKSYLPKDPNSKSARMEALKKKAFYNPDSPLTDDEWLDNYLPLTPKIVVYKYSHLIYSKIQALINVGRISMEDKEDAYQHTVDYILTRLGSYNPKYAQSNWLTWEIRGALTDFTRKKYSRETRENYFSEMAVVGDDEAEEGSSEEFNLALSYNQDTERKIELSETLFQAFQIAQEEGMFANRTINEHLMAETLECLESGGKANNPLSLDQIAKLREIIINLTQAQSYHALVA